MLARRKKEEKFIAYRGRIPRSGEEVYGKSERIKKKREKKNESYEVVKRSNRLKYRERERASAMKGNIASYARACPQVRRKINKFQEVGSE